MTAGSARPFMMAGASGAAGSPAYLSTDEVFHDISSGDLTLTAADMGKPHAIYSGTEGRKVILPAGNAAGMVLGKGAGFRIMKGSRIVPVMNAGTPGTDAVLEAAAMDGAEFSLIPTASTVTGAWRTGSGSFGLFAGPVPVKMPFTQDAGVDLGSVAASGSMQGFTDSVMDGWSIAKLSPTQYVVVAVPNAGTSVVAYPVSYNFATDTFTWGSPVTVFSSANAWSFPKVVALGTTKYAVAAFEGTANTVSVRGGSVAANAITQGTTSVSSAWTADPGSSIFLKSGGIIADSATTFFLWGGNSSPKLVVAHFSISGNNVAHDGSALFASSTAPSGSALVVPSASPAANVLDIPIDSAGSLSGAALSRYTYSGGSVTNTFNLATPSAVGGYFQLVDATNRVYMGGVGTFQRLVLDAGGTKIVSAARSSGPVPDINTATALTPYCLTETDAIAFRSTDSATVTAQWFCLFNPLKLLAKGTTTFSSTVNSPGRTLRMNHLPFATEMIRIFGFAFDATTRTMTVHYSNPQTLAQNRGQYLAQLYLPRNYDDMI